MRGDPHLECETPLPLMGAFVYFAYQLKTLAVMTGQNQTKETEGNPSMCLTRVERREARRRRFDDVMHILSEHEFFVDERSIMDVLRGVSHYLSDLHTCRETAAALRRAYPSWNWDSQ